MISENDDRGRYSARIQLGVFVSDRLDVSRKEKSFALSASSLVAIRTFRLGAGALLLACLGASSAHAALQTPAAAVSGNQARASKVSSSQASSNQASTGKTAPATKPHSATAGSSKSAAASHHTASASGKRPSSRRKKTVKARGQQKIDSERTHAIQEALIREHYLSGEATGQWNDATENALRRYQSDHGWQSKTVPDSRALIKLGLGPSHDHLLNPESAMTTSADAPRAAPVTPASHSTDPGAPMSTSPAAPADSKTAPTPTPTPDASGPE
jgi:hypothetical protein